MSFAEELSLAGRVALVTGASSGIGQATAIALAVAGARVGIHFRSNEGGARATLDAVRNASSEGMLIQGDLSEPNEAHTVVDACVRHFGRLDILFNNAGSPIRMAPISECSYELWRRNFDVNVHSAFLVTQRAIPALRASKRGSIINNLSLSVQTGGSGGAGAYAAAKGALHVMTRTLAKELAPDVRSNAIMPGVIETPHHEEFTSAEKMENYRRQTPLARNGLADEVAAAVVFLASEAASFINGAILDINGGRFLR
ncbi:MAG: SDR family NAD(P)-dependent oxidoreductase [Gemmataceae bacterium]